MKSEYNDNINRSNITSLISNSSVEEKQSTIKEMSSLEERRLSHKVNLAAAFHDHISCTKLPSQICKVGGDINSLIGASLNNCSSFDASHSLLFASSTSPSEDKQQIERLKDMILMQLDLIQHQQEQLLKKDRQLQGLKQDREALCLRLEKMEKRITFLTSKLLEINSENKINNQVIDNSKNNSTDESLGSSEGEVLNTSKIYSGKSVNSTVKINNTVYNEVNQNTVVKNEFLNGSEVSEIKVKEENNVNNTKTQGTKDKCSLRKRNRLSKLPESEENSNDSESVISSKMLKEEPTNETTKSVDKRRRTTSKNVKGKYDLITNDSVNTSKTLSTNVNILETEEPYDLYNCRQEITCSLEEDSQTGCDVSFKQKTIEVPSWRLNPISSCYQLEGTENLDDEVFLRRHSKQEMDEKRRKRWDIQRLREQRHNERLRLGRYNNNNSITDKNCDFKKKSIDLNSFFPEPKDVQFIEVSDKLPIMAFGLPIPNLPEKPFSLPWLKSSSRSTKSQNKTCNS